MLSAEPGDDAKVIKKTLQSVEMLAAAAYFMDPAGILAANASDAIRKLSINATAAHRWLGENHPLLPSHESIVSTPADKTEGDRG